MWSIFNKRTELNHEHKPNSPRASGKSKSFQEYTLDLCKRAINRLLERDIQGENTILEIDNILNEEKKTSPLKCL